MSYSKCVDYVGVCLFCVVRKECVRASVAANLLKY